MKYQIYVLEYPYTSQPHTLYIVEIMYELQKVMLTRYPQTPNNTYNDEMIVRVDTK